MSVPPPQTLVLFGASGDLTRRKVLPALWSLFRRGELPERFAVLGYARSPWDSDAFRAHARESIAATSSLSVDEFAWNRFARALHFQCGVFDEPRHFRALPARLEHIESEIGTGGRRLYYCATPPSAFPVIVERLGECGIRQDDRIVIEKPFGRDLESAHELNRIVSGVFDEPQVFRIDHYLGKETVQNILVLRFFNSMFERVWNRDAIDQVQITVAESVGVEGRGAYYEEAGALRDMVQNHLLQVLCFLAMEPPRSLEPDAIRDEKVKVLRALRPLDPADVVRGQYADGDVDGHPAPGYRDEPDVAPDSSTETFVAIRARIDNWRWAGVPFFLRTGKRLPRRVTEVAVVFRNAPEYLAESAGIPRPLADHLTIRIQPEEGISFAFQAKERGEGFSPRTARMDFSYGGSFGEPAEAYERLLHDAMVGDHTLFPRGDGVLRSWELIAPALGDPTPLQMYPAGSWGPPAANELIATRTWHLR